MCLRTSSRSTISAGPPRRPRLRLLGRRFPSASYTIATTSSSASTSSACRIQLSRRSLTSSAISPSPKLSCSRRISIMLLLPLFGRGPLWAQQVMIEFANGLDRLLQFLVIGKPAAHFLNPLAAHADLTRASAGIGHRQHEDLVAFAARAFRASRAVTDRALQQRSAQQLAGDRHFADQLVTGADRLLANHSQE